MAITDNLLVKIQPDSGDTFVKNLIDNSDAASTGSGTVTLQNDAGLYGWQIQGDRVGTFTGGTHYEGGAVTVAVRFKANARQATFGQYLAVKGDTSSYGARVSNAGTTTGNLSVSEVKSDQTTTVIGQTAYTTGQYVTFVIRLKDNGFDGGQHAYWKGTTGRVGTTPDGTVAAAAAGRNSDTFNSIYWGATGENLTFVDLAVWQRGLTDAECAAVADDIRNVVNGGTPPADTTPPTITAAAVANATPTIVALTASEALDAANVPAASAWTVSGHTVTNVAISGSTINLTVTPAFVNGEAASVVGYTQPGTADVRDAAGNLLANFSGQAITNNVQPADVTAPTFSSAQVANASPSVIQATFSETLANSVPPTSAFAASGGRTVTGVSIAGAVVSITVNTPYVNGDAITIAYTQPGSNPRLQDAAGNLTATFGAQSVTNNVAPAASGTFQTVKLSNNTATGWPSGTAVHWQWHQAGRIGSAATSITYGTGTLAADGTLTMTGLPAGAGFALIAKRNATFDLDNPFYQPGVVS